MALCFILLYVHNCFCVLLVLYKNTGDMILHILELAYLYISSDIVLFFVFSLFLILSLFGLTYLFSLGILPFLCMYGAETILYASGLFSEKPFYFIIKNTEEYKQLILSLSKHKNHCFTCSILQIYRRTKSLRFYSYLQFCNNCFWL